MESRSLFSYSPHTVHYLILITEKTKKGEKKIARIWYNQKKERMKD